VFGAIIEAGARIKGREPRRVPRFGRGFAVDKPECCDNGTATAVATSMGAVPTIAGALVAFNANTVGDGRRTCEAPRSSGEGRHTPETAVA
jgi:hypothetical protein